jgi:hypothetical protein
MASHANHSGAAANLSKYNFYAIQNRSAHSPSLNGSQTVPLSLGRLGCRVGEIEIRFNTNSNC